MPAFVAWGRRDDPVVKRAIRFTRDRQTPDGSWGDVVDPFTPSREVWTALAVLTLQAVSAQEEREAIQRGIAYLLRRQQPDGHWIGGFFNSDIVKNSEKKEDIYLTSIIIVLLDQSQSSR